jgi:hypothetical protein
LEVTNRITTTIIAKIKKAQARLDAYPNLNNLNRTAFT